MNQVQSIMDSIRRIVRALRTSSRISENNLGLRTAQVFVLQQLEKCEPVSLNELAEKTYSHQSTVSVVVNTLVEEGYVRRDAVDSLIVPYCLSRFNPTPIELSRWGFQLKI